MFRIVLIIAVLATYLYAKTTTGGFLKDGEKVTNKVRQQYTRHGRGLSQQKEENIIISSDQCNPSIQDCTGGCDDKVPLGAPFDCQTYSQLNLCSTLQPDYCKSSCGKCAEQEEEEECVDVPVPGADCSAVVNSGSCNADSIKGIFCAKSCGTCSNQTTDNGDSALKQFIEPTIEPSPLPSAGNCEANESLECDVAALLAFKESLVAGGDLLSDWVGSDPCAWTYITCFGGTNNKRVTKIEMDFYQTNQEDVLSGSIPPEFSNLRFLETINLDSNQMQGFLYKEFSVLTSLTEFQMVRLGLSGSLPPEYSTLSLLEIFRVSYNSLTGIIPPDWTTWSKLYDFILAENRLSGTLLPEYSIFSKMDTLDVGDNFMSGQIPVKYSEWKECRTFTTARNSFTGPLPVQFSVMKQMDYLFVTDNQLTGTLPENFSEWVDCETFWVGDNRISGTLPVEYSKMQRMKEFGVENNGMSGVLPVEYSRMRKLQEFTSTGNSITSLIPGEWSQLERFAKILV